MKQTKKLDSGDLAYVRTKINELTNAQNTSVDTVGDKQFFVTLNLFGVKQTSFTVEKPYPGRTKDSVLSAKNTSICLPIPDNIDNEEEFKQSIKEMCPHKPDRIHVQDSIDDNHDRICNIGYNYKALAKIIFVIEKFDEEYDSIR